MSRPDLTLIDGGDGVDRQATRWFVRLRADDASEGDRRAWQQWLEASRDHRDAYAREEALWSSFGDFAASPEIGARIAEASRAPQAAPVRVRGARRRWPAAMAATLALLAVGTFAALRLAAPKEAAYQTAIGERRSVQLDDGSRIDLDAGTQLGVRYDRGGRHIVLEQGRAFFQVAKDAARPFDVVTDAGSVRALGTQFEVSQVAGAADVALYEGSVELRARAAAEAPPQRLGVLVPGQQARLSAGRMQMRATTVAAGARPAWLSGRLVFSDTPLAEAAGEFNRYSPSPIVLQGEGIGDYRITGVFRGSDADGFIEALRDVYGIRSRREADGSRVLLPPP